jgi:DNA-binding transcriptional MerR regulator
LSSSQLPPKLYFRIGEVARIVDVEPHVLRYWETEFRSVRPRKSSRGQRVYTRKDVETLIKVRELLYSHRFTIEGARKRLREGGLEPVEAAPAPEPRGDVRRAREELLELRGEVAAFLEELGG